ncbi:MAG: ABC transporter permease subunit [Caldilineales bacterium]|nr:ABC transporter permease subunit [Caldilineales bacterium]
MENTLPTQTIARIPARPSLLTRRTLWLLLVFAAVAWSLARAGVFSGELVNTGGIPQLKRFLVASLNPALDPDFLALTLQAALTTVAFAVTGASLSTLFGFIGGLFASEVWWQAVLPGRYGQGRRVGPRAPWLLIRTGLSGIRGIHEIIWGLIFLAIVGLDPLTAILAIAIPYGAITAKVFSEILDETPRNAYQSLRSSGVSTLKAMAYGLYPLAMRDLISYGFYRFECSLRAATVLGLIGAGGLGFEIFVSLQTLRYPELWTLFYALFLLNAIIEVWSVLVRRRLGSSTNCSDLCYVPATDSRAMRKSVRSDPIMHLTIILLLVMIPLSFWYLSPDWGKLFSARAVEQIQYLVSAAFPPDFSRIPLSAWLNLTGITLAMSILAAAIAGLFAVLVAFPAAGNFLLPGGLLDSGGGGRVRRIFSSGLLFLTRGILLISRSIPPPIWALILLFVLFPGIVPGALALAVYTIGVLGRLMAEVVENVDERPSRAIRSVGAGASKVFVYGILPPTTPKFLGFTLYRWEEIMRATVVIGLVGAGGLGRLLVEQLSSFDYSGALATLLIFVGLVFLVDMCSHLARRAFRTG